MLNIVSKKNRDSAVAAAPRTALACAMLSAIVLTACSAPENTDAAASNAATTAATSQEQSAQKELQFPDRTRITETSGPAARLAVTYDGGVLVLDGDDLKVVADRKKEGFLRLNPAGNNRHLMVADGSSYTLLDLGAWAQGHGDHNHYYATSPEFAQSSFAADGTGHVIPGHGRVALFADGTGTFEIYQPENLVGEDNYTAQDIATTTVALPAAHHGFAIPLENDTYLVSVGDENKRTGAAVVDANGKVIVESKECEGIHGEAHAANETYSIGCQDGTLIYQDGTFTKVSNPEDPYSRSGNQAGDPNSTIVLADYKIDKDAELERPEQFALIDTVAKTRTKVALPKGVSYTFRSLARGPQGSHLLLTTDGKLRIWAEHGEEIGAVDVVAPWQESTVWQDPRPAIWVDGDRAYVTEPATKQIHIVDLSSLQAGAGAQVPTVVKSAELPEVPNEINGVPRGSRLVTAHEVDAH